MKAADKEAISVCFHRTMKAAKVSEEIAKLFQKGIFSHSFNAFVGKADMGCFGFKDNGIKALNPVGHLLELMGYKPSAPYRYIDDCTTDYFHFNKVVLIDKIYGADRAKITEQQELLARYLKQFNVLSRQNYPANDISPNLYSTCRVLKNIGSVFKKYVL